MSYAQGIYKLLSNYLPLTNIELGQVIPIVDVSISGSDLIMEVSPSDYAFIQDQMSINDNYAYTASNFRIKNNIVSMTCYPTGATGKFGFLVRFERILRNCAGTDITLKGFTDTNFDITYRIARKIDDYNLLLIPQQELVIDDPIGVLGYYPTLYASGLNGLKIIQNAGPGYLISFPIEPNTLQAVSNVNDLDLTTMPNLWFYQQNLLAMNLSTFRRNETDSSTKDYLLIDTTSLVGSPIRSKSNNTDAPYFSFGSNAYFYRNYTIDIAYIIERSDDDEDNQTKSGSDITDKQVKMFDALTSVLRRPLPSDGSKVISSITITEDSVDKVILEGSVVIFYQANFTINYLPDSVLDLTDEGVYKINQINYNTDEIIV